MVLGGNKEHTNLDYMIVEVPVKIWVTRLVFQHGRCYGNSKHNYSPLFIKCPFVTMEKYQIFVLAYVFSFFFHLSLWLLDDKVWPYCLLTITQTYCVSMTGKWTQSDHQTQQIQLKGGWKMLDLA